MKHILFCLVVLFSALGFAHGQTPEQMKKSDDVLNKMRQIDLLVQIIPLALTKDQINALLDVVERARAKVSAAQKDEAEKLAKLERTVDDAIKKAVETNVAPPKALLDDLAHATAVMTMNRLTIIDDNTTAVENVIKRVCNAGQIKVMQESLAPQLIDPSLKPDKMTAEDKLKLFIQNILLDPQSHEILVQLAKHAS
jgi:hypothetical protein